MKRLQVHNYVTEPDRRVVPLWALGYGTALRTVLLLWTPNRLIQLTLPRLTRTPGRIVWRIDL